MFVDRGADLRYLAESRSSAVALHRMMIWIIVVIAIVSIAALSVLAAAKRGRRRSLVPVKFQFESSLLTLANNTALLATTVATLQQDFDIVTTHLNIAVHGQTPGEGPLEFGIAETQYSVTEIVEALDASPTSQYGVAQERSSRKVRSAGLVPGLLANETLNDGVPVKCKMFTKAFGNDSLGMMSFWTVNRSNAALTTGTVVEVTGVHWGRWK